MAAIDDLKSNVQKLTASQAAFNAEQITLLQDVLSKLTSGGGASEQAIEDSATTIGNVVSAIDANTQALKDFDAANLTSPAPPAA